MSYKVLIADDHRIVREGLRCLLEKEHDINVVGDAGDGRTILQVGSAAAFEPSRSPRVSAR